MRSLLITIDTEADDQWDPVRRLELGVRNVATLPRFQALCERYGFRPTYLTTWQVATQPSSAETLGQLARAGRCELGTHLHAWSTPPYERDLADEMRDPFYAYEVPPERMRAKLQSVHDAVTRCAGAPPTSYRAGRWGMDVVQVRALAELGYRIDSSVTPGVSWAGHPGRAGGAGGPDYRTAPSRPFALDERVFPRPGSSPVLELPVTIARPLGRLLERVPPVASRFPPWRRLERTLTRWVRPTRRSRAASLALTVSLLERAGHDAIVFVLHSSELAPGTSPIFPTERDHRRLFHVLEAFFAWLAKRGYVGETLREYAGRVGPELVGTPPASA